MRKYLLIEINAQKLVMVIPKIKTAVITINMTDGVITAKSSGSYLTRRYAIPISSASAIEAAMMPTHRLRTRNGRRMNDQLAPTSFIV